MQDNKAFPFGCSPKVSPYTPSDVTLTFEVPNQEAGDKGDEQEDTDDNGDDHAPLRAPLLHLLGVHGREELHPFLQVVHVLGGQRRQEGGKAVPKPGLERSRHEAVQSRAPHQPKLKAAASPHPPHRRTNPEGFYFAFLHTPF